MKVTLNQIYGNWAAVGRLSDLNLGIKQSYGLARFIRESKVHYDDVETQRTVLVKKYGTEDDAGNTTVGPDNYDAFMSEFTELLTTEVEVYDPGLTIDNLGDVKISAAVLIGLDWLIKDDATGGK